MNAPGASTPIPESLPPAVPVLPYAPVMPFKGFAHAGGLAAGLTAGILAAVAPLLDERAPALAVGLSVIGAINAYLLSLVNRSLLGSMAALGFGFLLGLLSFGTIALVSDGSIATDPSLLPKLHNPLLVAMLCPFLGAGPLALTMFFQENRPKGIFLRLMMGTMSGGLAAAAGLVVYGMLSTLNHPPPEYLVLLLAFLGADYLLFRLQVLFLIETTPGDQVERPGIDGGATSTPGLTRDDEP